ncbi:MAG: putative immunity protein [Clostridia bacterium]
MNDTDAIGCLFLKCDHMTAAIWAHDCAFHVLHIFEDKNQNDERPRAALKAARDWAFGEMSVGDARKAAFAAYACAREQQDRKMAFCARACGHAAATAHVKEHALHASAYALKAADDEKAENDWQYSKLKTLTGL